MNGNCAELAQRRGVQAGINECLVINAPMYSIAHSALLGIFILCWCELIKATWDQQLHGTARLATSKTKFNNDQPRSA